MKATHILHIDQWVEPRSGLGHIETKLKSGPCRIAYLGASVTVQKTGYRPLLHQWLIDHFGQPHVAINAAIGGVGSVAGVFLMDTLVIAREPDLCLIEFSTGDAGQNTPLELIGPVVEGIIRKLRNITCEICMLHLFRTDALDCNADQVIAEYEHVADFYGIPTIRVDRHIKEGIRSNQWQARTLFRDVVHTNDFGSQLVSGLMGEGLLHVFNHPARDPGDRTDWIQKRLFVNHFETTEIIGATEQMLSKPSVFSRKKFRFFYDFLEIDTDNAISIQTTDEIIGILVIVGPDSGIIKVAMPDGEIEYQLLDQWCYYDRLNAVVFPRHEPGLTFVKVRLTTKTPMAYTARGKKLHTEGVQKKLKIIGFMVRK